MQFWFKLFATLSLCVISVAAQAVVDLNRTRLVIEESDPRASSAVLKLKNSGRGPVLVQNWVEAFQQQPAPVEAESAVFVNPPLMRIEPGSQGFVRVVPRDVSALPRDRESIFHLNVHGIPQSSADESKAKLAVSILSKIKVFYRPVGLPGNPASAVAGLQWSLVSGGGSARVLRATNDAAHSVSIATHVRLRRNDQADWIVPVDVNTLPAKSSVDFVVPADAPRVHGDEKVLFGYVDDLGSFHETEGKLAVSAARD